MDDILNVTANHILDGNPGDNCYCPIAMAARDHFGPIDLVSVVPTGEGGVSLEFVVNGNSRSYALEKIAVSPAQFVKSFDSGKRVRPCAFLLQEKHVVDDD